MKTRMTSAYTGFLKNIWKDQDREKEEEDYGQVIAQSRGILLWKPESLPSPLKNYLGRIYIFSLFFFFYLLILIK